MFDFVVGEGQVGLHPWQSFRSLSRLRRAGGDLVGHAEDLLAMAERQGATIVLGIGHRTLGTALITTGSFSEGRRHLDQAVGPQRLTTHDWLGRARCPAQLGSARVRSPLTERRHNSRRFFLPGLLGGGRLFRAHVIKHAREDRNVGLLLDQRTEMIGVK